MLPTVFQLRGHENIAGKLLCVPRARARTGGGRCKSTRRVSTYSIFYHLVEAFVQRNVDLVLKQYLSAISEYKRVSQCLLLVIIYGTKTKTLIHMRHSTNCERGPLSKTKSMKSISFTNYTI